MKFLVIVFIDIWTTELTFNFAQGAAWEKCYFKRFSCSDSNPDFKLLTFQNFYIHKI